MGKEGRKECERPTLLHLRVGGETHDTATREAAK